MKALTTLAILSIATGSLIGCSSTVKYGDSTRLQTQAAPTKDGQDLLSITDQLSAEMLQAAPVLALAGSERPLIAITDVRNKTQEKLDAAALTDILYGKLANSGQFQLASHHLVTRSAAELTNDLSDPGNYLTKLGQLLSQKTGAKLLLHSQVQPVIKIAPTSKNNYQELVLTLIKTDNGKVIWSGRKSQLKSSTKATYGI